MDNSKLLVEHGIDVEQHTLYITEDINNECLNNVLLGLAALRKSEEVTVYLATDGGCPYAAYGIYDALRQFEAHVKVICVGGIFSAGTIIMQAGDTRVMTENSTLLIHFGYAAATDGATETQHKKLNKKIVEMLSESTEGKTTKKTVAAWMRGETYFNAERALECGLIDRILENV